MTRIQLIHWNSSEARQRADLLASLGHEVVHELPPPRELLKRLRADPPEVVVIDLSRLPSQGRDMGVLLRQQASTRRVPLVFVGGNPDKIRPVRELLPDAAYTSWDDIAAALPVPLVQPLQQPVVPGSAFAAYAGRPLAQKLGIRPRAVVALVDPPAGFIQLLGALPEDVQLRREGSADCDLTLWFVRSWDELRRGMHKMVAALGGGRLWIAWPKKASRQPTDLGQRQVRESGLAAGLVDYKICAIDATWSALLFARRGRRA